MQFDVAHGLRARGRDILTVLNHKVNKALVVLPGLVFLAAITTFVGLQQFTGKSASTNSEGIGPQKRQTHTSSIEFVDTVEEARIITGIDAKELRVLPAGWTRTSIIAHSDEFVPNVSQRFYRAEAPGEWFEITQYQKIRYTEGESFTIAGKPARRLYLAPGSEQGSGRLSLFWNEGEGGILVWGMFDKLLTEQTLVSIAEQLRSEE